jgi:hypothetical protein
MLAGAALLAAAALTPVGAAAATTTAVATGPLQVSLFDAHLTRAPYLTDLVSQHVAINFATDQSATTASVSYGPVVSGSCTPSTTVTATRRTITVGTVSEYQWTSQINLPSAGTYCYRPTLGSSDDLLGGNPSPMFTTQVQAGDGSPFSFDVLGDWGQVDSSGQNPGQAALMQQIAASGARFLVTVGDNGYPNGNQVNYGDLQHPATSAIFGPSYWTVPGPTVPIFTVPGNHGLSGTTHTDITTWTQNTVVSQSGGRYQDDVYCCVNGTNPAHYASEWYAFTAGNARFYMLDAAWGDSNKGTSTVYGDDYAAHWAPGTPEYQWLANDLAAHPTQLKFAFFHYPLYADNPQQDSDTYLDGPSSLEGLLASNGVQIVFNGHAHIYERNKPSAAGMPVSYVTGGGGGTLQPIGPCTSIDAYGIGWSPTKLKGYSCGGAPRPTSASQVFHFLKVTVSGSTVTVTPTDSQGNTFDVQTYQFGGSTDTWIDSGPANPSGSSSATFTFHGSDPSATFSCTLDGGAAQSCTSPVTYTGLAEGSHTFTVAATVGGSTDPTPASSTWVVDTTAPAAPTGLTAQASATEVDLSWTGSTDSGSGIAGYRVYRNGTLLARPGNTTSYADTQVSPGTTYSYWVTAVDNAGNESPASNTVTVTTPQGTAPVFSDGFESGSFSQWNTAVGLKIEGSTVHSGSWAAEGNTTNGATYAKKTLPATYPDAYAQVWFDIVSQASQVNLLRLRTAGGTSLGYVYVTTTGRIGVHNDTTGSNTLSATTVTPGWHAVQLRIAADSSPGTATGALQVWLDGTLVGDISSTAVDVGATPVGAVQIGETQTGRTYDVVFDDAAVATSRLATQ